jgi:DNA-binding XRE family transcriptional regulator
MLVKDLIKQIRIRCALTQEELADNTHITQSTISALELGKRKASIRTIKTLVDMANKKAKMGINYSDIEDI